MKSQDDIRRRSDNQKAVEIKPIAFRPRRKAGRSRSWGLLKWLLGTILVTVTLLLGVLAWFVFTARQVVIQIEPEPEHISIHGGIPALNIGGYYLMRPGAYTLQAAKECFQPLEQQLTVVDDKGQHFNFTLAKQPGRLSIQAHQADKPSITLEGAHIFIDGQEIGRTPLSGVTVKPGPGSLAIEAENYQTRHIEIKVAGCDKHQELNLALVPAWAEISLQSEPRGASILVDGQSFGATPSTIKLMGGEYDLEIRADRFKPWRTRLAVAANQSRVLDTIRLQPADGRLVVRTNPSGASVLLGETFVGQTPLQLPLPPDETHLIQISRAGYEKVVRKVKLLSEESETLDITLKPKMGTINFLVQPADAELFVDGKPMGKVPSTLRLVAVEHELEIKKQGYQGYRSRITPRPGYPQEINIALKRLSSTPDTSSGVIKAKNGYELKLIVPQAFVMGSSRREQGRRSNETLRNVKLQRPFYMGIREVTNREFRQFMSAHNSGTFKKHDLARDDLPVVEITWRQAALFCNWLSIQESLPPVYVQQGGRMIAADPPGIGYRLPTEAEWEYCARSGQNGADLKYTWGNTFPPPAKAGNFADQSAKDLLTTYLSDYNDGYPVSAPAAKFKPNGSDIYDLGGNVSEWSHDYYSIYSYDSQKVYIDPVGPKTGKHHVVRGSSWMQAGISELRNAYRDYSDSKRSDLGFRICRYMK
ncbi:MAG: PEGA domain-containing protein [Desulfobacterales bacterium]|nr:MAG: PEGA domain-containing protein [Desulfobacterales bacterium]